VDGLFFEIIAYPPKGRNPNEMRIMKRSYLTPRLFAALATLTTVQTALPAWRLPSFSGRTTTFALVAAIGAAVAYLWNREKKRNAELAFEKEQNQILSALFKDAQETNDKLRTSQDDLKTLYANLQKKHSNQLATHKSSEPCLECVSLTNKAQTIKSNHDAQVKLCQGHMKELDEVKEKHAKSQAHQISLENELSSLTAAHALSRTSYVKLETSYKEAQASLLFYSNQADKNDLTIQQR
jgi:hypothetical protein